MQLIRFDFLCCLPDIFSTYVTGLIRQLLKFFNMPANRINVFFNVLYRTDGKFLFLVNRTKCAAVPWAVSSYTNKQAVCLAWRSYRPLFKTIVLLGRFIFKVHIDIYLHVFNFLRKIHFYLYSYTASLCLGNIYFLLTHL